MTVRLYIQHRSRTRQFICTMVVASMEHAALCLPRYARRLKAGDKFALRVVGY